MNLFKVNTASMKKIASNLKSAASKTSDISNEVDGIAREIRRTNNTYNAIGNRLEQLARSENNSAKNIETLQTSLIAICTLYEDTESKIIGNTQDKSLHSIADSATQASNGVNGQQGNLLLKNTPDADKDKLIDEYEKNNPYDAKKINEFLKTGVNNKITEEDIKNIKFLIYSAPEPYKTAYLQNIWKFKIANGDNDINAFYSSSLLFGLYGRSVEYDYPDSFADDPRGPYTTFFHECGHGIDDLGDQSTPWGYDTQTFKVYSDEMGKEITVKEAIKYDVYYNEKNPHSVTSMASSIIDRGGTEAGGDIDAVIKAFQNGNPENLSDKNRELYDAILVEQTLYHNNRGAEMESVSDVYGGVSNNALSNGYYHRNDYWVDDQNPGRELWAEYFSYNMARDDKALENLKEYFPESYKVLEEYANCYQ